MLLPGFAFREQDGRHEGLLTGRSAHLITTIDMPPWVYRLIYRAPGTGALKRSILGFCGIETLQSLALGPVKDADAARRAGWLEQARRLGHSLKDGGRSRAGRIRSRVGAWLQALRLQFYPMTWMAYTIGALGVLGAAGHGSTDRRADRGWRVEPTGLATCSCSSSKRRRCSPTMCSTIHRIDATAITARSTAARGADRAPARLAGAAARHRRLPIAALGSAGLLIAAGAPAASVAAMAAMLLLALGYTVPPLKLCWRGLGELDVGATHSLGVMLCGYLLQGGAWRDAFPWLASVPLFLAILPSIMLAGFPDLEADRAVGKGTLAVRLGHRGILRLAMLPALLAPAAAWLVKDVPALRGCYDGLLPFALAHAALLCAPCCGASAFPGRIDGLLICAMTPSSRYVALPLWHLAR